MDRTQIERYAQGPADFERAVRGLTPAQLDARPIPGTWTIREIAAHLYDSDMVGCDRMRRVAALENPLIMAYDESRYVARLDYAHVDVVAAVGAFGANRLLMTAVLRCLHEEVFERSGIHSERGRETLAQLVTGYCDHLDHHLKHLLKKRELVTRSLRFSCLLSPFPASHLRSAYDRVCRTDLITATRCSRERRGGGAPG